MKTEVLSQFNLPMLSVFAMILFIGMFLTVVFFVFRGKSKPYYERASQLPLEGDLKNGNGELK